MPSRWQSLLIVALWVAATGWLYVRELEPTFREHDPPPYVIELTDESQTVHPVISWKVFQNEQTQESYRAQTWRDHNPQDESFTLHAEVKPYSLQSPEAKENLLVQEMRSEYRVSREGKLLMLHVEAELTHRLVPGRVELGFKPRIELTGIVAQGQINAHLKLPQFSGILSDSQSNFQFPVSQNGVIFLPLHPVHKIHGVRPGKTWSVPEVDPLSDAMRAWVRKFGFPLPDKGDRILDARVRDRAEEFPYDIGDRATHQCWVIDYRRRDAEADKTSATTWVEVDTELVLCQEGSSEAGKLRLVRDTASSKIR
jgi:hypothetical protein